MANFVSIDMSRIFMSQWLHHTLQIIIQNNNNLWQHIRNFVHKHTWIQMWINDISLLCAWPQWTPYHTSPRFKIRLGHKLIKKTLNICCYQITLKENCSTTGNYKQGGVKGTKTTLRSRINSRLYDKQEESKHNIPKHAKQVLWLAPVPPGISLRWHTTL